MSYRFNTKDIFSPSNSHLDMNLDLSDACSSWDNKSRLGIDFDSNLPLQEHENKNNLSQEMSNGKKEILIQNKYEKAENTIDNSIKKIKKELFILKNENVEKENKYDCDYQKFYHMQKDNQINSFSIFKNGNMPNTENNDENKCNAKPNTNINNSNIYFKKGEKENPKKLCSTFFTTIKNDEKKIQYKKEGAKKKIKNHILKTNLKKLNKYIRKYLPPKYKRRNYIIHAPNSNLLSSKVSDTANKKYLNMKFRRILTYGQNKITKKNLQYKNYLNIKEIMKYINEYYKKNNYLPIGLRKIKKLLNMKPLDLISNFVKSKDFKKFKKEKQSIIFREGIINETEKINKIDIFTEKGIFDLFKPLDNNKNNMPKDINSIKNKKKSLSGAYRKCLQLQHLKKLYSPEMSFWQKK